MPRGPGAHQFPDTSALESQLHTLIAHGLAVNTRRAYGSGVRSFDAFARHYNLVNADGSPYPASQVALSLFVAFLSRSLSYSTIKSTYVQFDRFILIWASRLPPFTLCA